MSTSLANLATAYVLSQAEMLTMVAKAGNRANKFLSAMAPFETTPNAVPTPISAFAGTYTLTAPGVIAVSNALGPRAASVLESMFLAKA